MQLTSELDNTLVPMNLRFVVELLLEVDLFLFFQSFDCHRNRFSSSVKGSSADGGVSSFFHPFIQKNQLLQRDSFTLERQTLLPLSFSVLLLSREELTNKS